MERPECAVRNCKNNAITAYGDKWICGECMMKIIQKEADRKNKQVEDLEI